MTADPLPFVTAGPGAPALAGAPGRFLSLEGIDGAGKSSHLGWAADRLRACGLEVITTREPGGTPLAERMRALLLGEPMAADTETLLVFAARAEHLARVIEPALARGAWVISDRFTDATYAYQCHGRGLDADRVAILERWVQKGRRPDRTWLFDVPPGVAADRRTVRAGEPGAAGAAAADRFESESDAFHRRVRDGYLALAQAEPSRFLVVDGRQTIEEIRAMLADDLDRLLEGASARGLPR